MTAALEDIKIIDIEDWLTLNTAAAPTKLKQGQTPNAKNVWVDEKPGSVITAPGLIKVGTLPSGKPGTFCCNYFKTSAGTQTFVVSDNATVWTTVDFQNFTQIITGLSSSFQLRGAVIRDKLWLTNGSDAVRTFDGTTVVVLDGTAGTPNVPKGRFIAYHDERVWVYHIPSNRSQCAFSALTDTSANIITPDNVNAWPSSNTLQISEGDADFGTALLLYRGYLHFFKQYTIWRLVGYDEYTYTRVKTRASTGTRFAESLQILDSLVHMIGIDGIYVFDGEETDRISDIIDPETAAQSSFGFNTLQQPNSNNQFWEVTQTIDWNAGTVPTNATISNQLLLKAADDTQADFNAGTTLTNIDTNDTPNSIKMSRQASGGSADRTGQGINAYLDDSGNGADVFGTPFWLTDGDTTRFTGLGAHGSAILIRFVVDLSTDQLTKVNIGRIIIRGLMGDDASQAAMSVQVNTGAYQTVHGNQGTWVTVGSTNITGIWSPIDRTIDFATQNAIQVSFLAILRPHQAIQCSEIEAYTPTYQTSATFVSKVLDYTTAPNSYGNFNADFDAATQTITFFTQSSTDGVSWDAQVAVVPGSAIGSALKRFLRWGANFTSNGSRSPIVNAAYLSLEYFSAIHDTGGSIFAWGPLESDYFLAAQTINFYYRGATTSGGVPGASWNIIVPGGVINMTTANQFVQFKVEILGATATTIPFVNSVTINWVKGSGTQPQTLQNVASFAWRNRYWLSAAGPSATANNTILVRGKKTFGSPWQLKDWNILAFTRFQDGFYGLSSVDGSIYQLDSGFSKAGSAMDAFFETGDFTFGGFYVNILEVLVEVERSGSYSLNVGISIDRGLTYTEKSVDLTASTFAPSYTKRLNFNMTTDRFRMRVRINGVDQPYQVHRLIAYYTMEAARGSIK